MATTPSSSSSALPWPSRWELAAEAIVIKIRWFVVLVGYLLVNLASPADVHAPLLNAILALGAVFTLLDTAYSVRGRILLGRYPLLVSAMEALFIGVLCYFHGGLESAFRYYYLLSLLCCAIRHSSSVTYATCALHGLSYGLLYLALPVEQRHPLPLVLTLVVLGWLTWASNALAELLKRIGDYLSGLNAALREQQALLEDRIAERTSQLQEAQAHVLHQEKMAAFGLLAAGIAHEVGNPLTAISSMVRELVNFSRPASTTRTRVAVADIIEEALNIAKYYKRTGDRILHREAPADLPVVYGVRDQLVQIVLNLVLNAIDATRQAGQVEPRIDVQARAENGFVEVLVRDNGCGIAPEHADRLFQPYFTTKRHGTGLGLFVTRKLIEEHDGSVTHQINEGGGATFRVCLPVFR
jgi:C4-dicarboxylate-specific signal transduction histidine kinase